MTIPVARLGDLSTEDPHPCKAPPRPCVVGSGNVFVNGMPAHRLGDAWLPHPCPGTPPHPSVTAMGSGSVLVNGMPLARMGDLIACGSTIAIGSPNVFAG